MGPGHEAKQSFTKLEPHLNRESISSIFSSATVRYL